MEWRAASAEWRGRLHHASHGGRAVEGEVREQIMLLLRRKRRGHRSARRRGAQRRRVHHGRVVERRRRPEGGLLGGMLLLLLLLLKLLLTLLPKEQAKLLLLLLLGEEALPVGVHPALHRAGDVSPVHRWRGGGKGRGGQIEPVVTRESLPGHLRRC